MFFSSPTFTLIHVAISLIAIASGFVVVYGLITGKRLDLWTATFLGTTAATSVTGFLFPFDHFTPGDAVGIISLVVLALALYARYVRSLAGGWRRVYVISAVVAFYLNFFVLIVQSFMKVSFLHDLAPTQSEPPFLIAQIIALVAFIAVGWLAVVRFNGEPRVAIG
jgi:hypothetical protein